MSKLRVHALSMSVDGYTSGPGTDQTLDDPFATANVSLHDWMLATRLGGEMFGNEGGSTGIDDDLVASGFDGIGATIMGRNMFTTSRGPWTDDGWRGWWGPDPVYHHPVFVLTHHEREPIEMEGGTTFHFVTDGIESALRRATDAAGGADVRLGGGATAVREYLRAQLVDEMHLVLTDVLLGHGESPFADVDLPSLGYRVRELIPSSTVTHVLIDRA